MIVNVNKVLKGLKDVLSGYDVADGFYTGQSDKYIVYTYADERGAAFGDNDELAMQATLQIGVYTPHRYNYLADKKKIKKYLKENGADGIQYMEFVEKDMAGTDYVRHQVFTAVFTTNE